MKVHSKSTYFPYAFKIMLPYLAIILLADIAIGYFSYTSSMRSMSENNEINLSRIMEQMRDNTTHQLKEYSKVSDSLYDDLNLQRLLVSKEDSYRVYEITETYILPALEHAIQLSANDVILSLYVKNTDYKERYSYTNKQQNPFQQRSFYNIYHLNRIQNEPWHQAWLKSSAIGSWMQLDNDAAFGNISYVQKLVSFDTFEIIGTMMVTAQLGDLFTSVSSFELTQGTNVLVLNRNDHSILYSRMPVNASYWDEAKLQEDHLIIKESLPGTDWDLIALFPLAILEKDAQEIRNVTVIVCVGSFLIASCIAIMVSKYFSKRVRNIVHMARSFRNGEFRKRIEPRGNDEFTHVSQTLNRMADNIEELIQEVYLKNLQKKEAELTALQAQISPHFLYNTLSSINSLAKLGQVDKLSSMVTGLAQFYRLTLNNGKLFTTIEKEVEQAQTYTEIQRMKYGNRFTFLLQVDSDILQFDTLKLILQPFIENALKHAWFEDHMTIRLTGRREGDSIIMQIIDDGVGFDMRSPMLRPSGNGGYGIVNVRERLQLQFGPGYGVTLFSRPGIGTTVQLVIPVYKQGLAEREENREHGL